MTRGPKTSEFWSMVATLGILVLAIVSEKVGATELLALAAPGSAYSLGRGFAKLGNGADDRPNGGGS